jgi:hypothetical protein
MKTNILFLSSFSCLVVQILAHSLLTARHALRLSVKLLLLFPNKSNTFTTQQNPYLRQLSERALFRADENNKQTNKHLIIRTCTR